MTWLVEDPTYTLIAAGIAAVILLVAIVKTGRGRYLTWLGGVVVLAFVLLLIERYVVTDRELVEETLYDAAAALEANDVEAVAALIAPSGEALEREIRNRMRTMEIRTARIADLQVEFSPLELPPKASAAFLGRLEFKDAGVPFEQILRRVRVALVEEDDRWLIQSYDLKR